MPVVDVAQVTHAFGQGTARRIVLDDVTVRFDEHRVGVIGANGSGKSTFVRLLNGLVVPDSGHVQVGGFDTRSHAKEVRKQVGFCFTDPDAQIVMPTVGEDVAFSLRGRGLAKDVIDTRVGQCLRRFGLDRLADHPAHLLSGGEKQLLALASVLVTDPALLVLDEPTTLLDLRNARMIAKEIADLDEQVVLVTHHLELLQGFDRVLVFDDARLVCDGEPDSAIEFYRGLMS